MMVLTLPEITIVSPSLYELESVFTEIKDSAKTGKVKTINKIKNPEIILVFTKLMVAWFYISFTILKWKNEKSCEFSILA